MFQTISEADPSIPQSARVLFEYGKNRDGYNIWKRRSDREYTSSLDSDAIQSLQNSSIIAMGSLLRPSVGSKSESDEEEGSSCTSPSTKVDTDGAEVLGRSPAREGTNLFLVLSKPSLT